MEPKVFISYSWSNQSHKDIVKDWADRLISDGIEIVLDIYDLKEGNDKYAFMEQMVKDSSVTHVLVICDKEYAKKANLRTKGVGIESQIISQEVYEKVEQSKFIPIVCEFNKEGLPFLPTFLKSRIWIDFSSLETVNKNWEHLVRLLYGKPLYEKPKLGKAPVFITSDISIPTSEASSKFSTLKQAILQDKKGINLYRRAFIDSCIDYADKLRVRERPTVDSLGEKVFDDTNKLKDIRDHLVNWILLERELLTEDEFSEILIEVLERLRKLKSCPADVTSWNETWNEAHSLFVYETFLYIIAALLKTQSYKVLHEVYTTHYLLPLSERLGNLKFEEFDAFYSESKTLQSVLSTKGNLLYSPAGELLKLHADREVLPFSEIMQADLLTTLMSIITPYTNWYPQTLYYLTNKTDFPFFIRTAQNKYFAKLSIITGITDINEFREKVKECDKESNVSNWKVFFRRGSFYSHINFENMNTIK